MDLDNYFESDSMINYYGVQVKEEYSEPQSFIDCLAITLNIDPTNIEWICENDPTRMLQLVQKAKRAIRREKAKLYTRVRQEMFPTYCESPKIEVKEEVPIIDLPKKRGKKSKQPYQSDTQSTSDENNQKKMVQMIRNRISAQISRDRKKVYLQDLEGRLKNNEDINIRLKRQVTEVQKMNDQISKENQILKRSLKIVKEKKKSKDIGLQIMMLASQYLSQVPNDQNKILLEEAIEQIQTFITSS